MDGSGFSQLTLSAPVMPALRVESAGLSLFRQCQYPFMAAQGEKRAL
ncbi:hypothetical protein [Budvicia aquatica]|nr:hypothetical protein [Budvicia aquatica]